MVKKVSRFPSQLFRIPVFCSDNDFRRFFANLLQNLVNAFTEVIAKRQAEMPEGAYTTYLFREGVDKILKKVGEEAAEVIIAAKNRDSEELRAQAS